MPATTPAPRANSAAAPAAAPASRRQFLRVLGGGTIAAAMLTGCDGLPPEAVQAWQGPAAGLSDPRQRAAAWGLLAPNPHNMQPWMVDLRQPGRMDLYIDPQRLLPQTDPLGRQIVIGCGCFLELARLAAAAEGWTVRVEALPEGPLPEDRLFTRADARPLARLHFSEAAAKQPDALFAEVPRRRSNKLDYAAEPLKAAHAAVLRGFHDAEGVSLVVEAERDSGIVRRLREITAAAGRIEVETPRTLKESVDLLRIGADEIRANPDGIKLHGPMMWWLRRFGVMTPEKALTPGTMAWQGALDKLTKASETAAAFGILSTPGNSRIDQLRAGAAYLRLNLKATQLGVAMHPLSQVLQEYEEMQTLADDFNRLVGTSPGHRVQMLFRLGYAKDMEPSPRRKLNDLLLT